MVYILVQNSLTYMIKYHKLFSFYNTELKKKRKLKLYYEINNTWYRILYHCVII